MKDIQNKLRVMFNAILAAALGVFGLTSCDWFAVKYGVLVPENDLEVNGEVTNEEGESLESMQVVLNTSKMRLKDTLYTNADGAFERTYAFPKQTDTLLLEINDTADVYASEKMQIPFAEMTKKMETEWETVYAVDIKVQLKKK